VGPDRFADRNRAAAGLWRERPHFRQDLDQPNIDDNIRSSGYNHNGQRCHTHYARPPD
jgi:hypothetical protein